MRSRPATRTASFVCSCSALVTARRRHDLLRPDSARKECRFCRSPDADACSCEPVSATAAVASDPSCFEKQVGGGGRNARATSSRSRACLEGSPRQSSFENRRLPLALPQSGKLRNYHVSLHPLLSRLLPTATQKTGAPVQKLWTTTLLCGRPRKTKNQSPRLRNP